MALFRSRLSLYDVLHRGFVYSLVGIAGWGIYSMGAVHFETMRRGRGTCSLIAANPELLEKHKEGQTQEEVKEITLAEAAQEAAMRARSRSAQQ